MLISLSAKERIVALSPAITEILFGLGAGDEVVGTSKYANYPKEAQNLPRIGGYFHPSLEKIVSLAPTLVIGNEHDRQLLSQIRALGIDTLAVRLKTLESIKTGIAKIGRRVGKKSALLRENIDSALDKVRKNDLAKRPRVLIIFGARLDLRSSIYVAGHDIFFEQIIEACGGTNAFSREFTGQPALHYEGLIAANPDIVIVLYSEFTNDADRDAVRKMWNDVPVNAAKNGRVYILDGDYISIPSHRVALTIRDICGVIR